MLDDIDMQALRRVPQVGYYFRYPLHPGDFRELQAQGRLCGHYTAKPLYGRLTPDGHVDTSAAYNGEIAALFVPLAATAPEQAELLVTQVDKERVTLPSGKKNWPVIRRAAEEVIKKKLGS